MGIFLVETRAPSRSREIHLIKLRRTLRGVSGRENGPQHPPAGAWLNFPRSRNSPQNEPSFGRFGLHHACTGNPSNRFFGRLPVARMAPRKLRSPWSAGRALKKTNLGGRFGPRAGPTGPFQTPPSAWGRPPMPSPTPRPATHLRTRRYTDIFMRDMLATPISPLRSSS